jgi:hypothetical protein
VDEFTGSEENDENNPGCLTLDLLWYIYIYVVTLIYCARITELVPDIFDPEFAISFTIYIYIFT